MSLPVLSVCFSLFPARLTCPSSPPPRNGTGAEHFCKLTRKRLGRSLPPRGVSTHLDSSTSRDLSAFATLLFATPRHLAKALAYIKDMLADTDLARCRSSSASRPLQVVVVGVSSRRVRPLLQLPSSCSPRQPPPPRPPLAQAPPLIDASPSRPRLGQAVRRDAGGGLRIARPRARPFVAAAGLASGAGGAGTGTAGELGRTLADGYGWVTL